MNLQVVCLLVLVAAVYAEEKVETLPISYLHSVPSWAYAPSYYSSILPSYNYYRVANLPLDRFPPGVDPIKCPNYPYCGTDAGKLVVPPSAPIIPTVPITDSVEAVRILKPTEVESDEKVEPAARLAEPIDSVKSDEKTDEIKTVPLTYYTLPGFASRFYYPIPYSYTTINSIRTWSGSK